jgi:hypothetical protein
MTLSGLTTLSGAGELVVNRPGPAITNSGTFTIAPGAEVQASECCVSPDQFINTGSVVVLAGGTATLGWLDFKDQGSVSIAPGSTLFVTVGPTELATGIDFPGVGRSRSARMTPSRWPRT